MNINEYIRKHHLEMNDTEMSRKLGIPASGVRSRRRRMGLIKSQVTTITEDQKLLASRERERAADKKYREALKLLAEKDSEVSAALGIRHGVSTYKISPQRGAKSEATAIWLASDWHVGEKVTLGQTNGINEYNPSISQERGNQFFINAVKLTKMMGRDVPIKKVILALLGDFITGHLHSQNVETNYLAPVEETLYAQSIIASGIEYVLKNTDYDLIIPCASGNHGRTTKFSEFGSENGHSHEFFMYCTLREHFKNNKRVHFIISEGAHTYLEVYGRQIRFLHGHDIKYSGGVGGITIPVNKAIAQWDKAKPAYLTCFGHFHQKFDGGNFLANGSLIGYNAYALSIKASAEPPAQQLCLIDSVRGKTGVWPILFTV